MESQRKAKDVARKFKKTEVNPNPIPNPIPSPNPNQEAGGTPWPYERNPCLAPTPTPTLTLQGMFSADKLKEEIVAPYKNQVLFMVSVQPQTQP